MVLFGTDMVLFGTVGTVLVQILYRLGIGKLLLILVQEWHCFDTDMMSFLSGMLIFRHRHDTILLQV